MLSRSWPRSPPPRRSGWCRITGCCSTSTCCGRRSCTGEPATTWCAGSWGGSTLGGHPGWIQDAEHLDCPGCEQPMDYIGLLYGGDLAEYCEGAFYLHLHASCGYTAVNFQQS
ncbi:hypothetical protein [Dactylosporangium sp. NPDC005555]|uniref:hypothetical protein n=1 Tax=Dactylosporangium sp. NPDC005555 TaxID=3154889 RepID=UPI0033B0F292